MNRWRLLAVIAALAGLLCSSLVPVLPAWGAQREIRGQSQGQAHPVDPAKPRIPAQPKGRAPMAGAPAEAQRIELLRRMERAASFVLARQDEHGAMNESGLINTDSNMLYAIMGLMAAYDCTGNRAYLRGAERGLAWLMSVQNPEGDWYLAYRRDGDRYSPALPDGYALLSAVRGVDTTMALFIHAAEQAAGRTADPGFRRQLREAASRAYQFLVRYNLDPSDGLFWSSFHLPLWWGTALPPLAAYRRHSVKYAADNAETYAGLLAAARLLQDGEAKRLAERLRQNFTRFVDPEDGRIAVMLDGDGDRGMRPSYARVFAWGWSLYLLGGEDGRFLRARDAVLSDMSGDGSFPGGYALSNLAYLLGERREDVPPSRLIEMQRFLFSLQRPDGGIADGAYSGSTYVNIAGLFLLYLSEELSRRQAACGPQVSGRDDARCSSGAGP